jgi:hypothetical protein
MGGQRTKKGTRSQRRKVVIKDTQSAFINKSFSNLSEEQEFISSIDLENCSTGYIKRHLTRFLKEDEGHNEYMSDNEAKHNLSLCQTQILTGDKVLTESESQNQAQLVHRAEKVNTEESVKLLKSMLYMNGETQLVEITETETMGKGVFASIDIPKGSYVTIYPAHYFCLKEGTHHQWQVPVNCDKTCKELQDYMNGDAKFYIMDGNHHRFIGDKNRLDQWWMLGHMINDTAYDGTDKYKPYGNVNCYFKGSRILTIKDIKKGEQLSVSYGSQYWFRVDEADNMSYHDLLSMLKEFS